jgi:hypothetical protein
MLKNCSFLKLNFFPPFQVDQFSFLAKALGPAGFVGHFVAKPDSPCLKFPEHVGPDGCAIFVHSGAFQVENVQEHVLTVDGTPSNQVALAVHLRSAYSSLTAF